MQRKLMFVLALLAIFGFASDASAASRTLDERLDEAEQMRSKGAEQFAELLKQLRVDIRPSASGVTKLQRQRLKYLQLYELGTYKNQREQAVEGAKQLIIETDNVNVKYRATALVANLSAINRRFGVGLRYLDRTLAMRGKVKDKNVRHEGVAVASMLYNEYGQYNVALRYADEVLRDAPSKRAQCVAGMFKIDSKYQLGLLSKDHSEIQQVIDSCLSIDEGMPASFARFTLARKLRSEGRTAEAIKLLESTFPEVEALGYPRLTSEIHSILAELKLADRQIDAAEAHATKAIALSGDIVSLLPLISGYKTLYRVAEIRNRPAEALEMYKRYAEAEKVRANDVKTRQLAYEMYKQFYRYELNQTKIKIASLQTDKKLLQADKKLQDEREQKSTIALVLLVVAVAGLALWGLLTHRHQSQLRRFAETDMLTGIANRHYFTQRSERALLESARDGEVSALVMFDLDHFKAINDTYGHAAGDWVLKEVSKTCASHCRKIDCIGRLGGEEFAILLHGIDLSAAARVAEDCRSKLAQLDTRDTGYTFVATASFGVTSTAQSGYDLSRLLSHADQMLYRAKSEGRNRVCSYTSDTAADQRSKRSAPALTVVGA
jgi:diguanylate cyclase